MKSVIACVLSLCLTWPALAAAGDMQLVGSARLKVLFWSVYDSRLYSEDGRYDPGKRPLRLEIEYLRDIPVDQLLQRTAQEWQTIGV